MAEIVDHLDLYQADGASFVDLRERTKDAIRTAQDLVDYLGPLLALL